VRRRRAGFGEPDLDLVEPGGVSGDEVETDAGIAFKECSDGWRFVGREIVQHDMDLLRSARAGDHLIEESDEFVTRVPLRGLALNFPVCTSSAA
jgi:hypothetical protein